jgi:hypothetical protein
MGVDQTVPLRDWIDLVRQGPEEDSSTHRNPARKILQFYEALADTADVGSGSSRPARKRFELGNMARCKRHIQESAASLERVVDQMGEPVELDIFLCNLRTRIGSEYHYFHSEHISAVLDSKVSTE